MYTGFLLLCVFFTAAAAAELSFLTLLHRHGDRAPYAQAPTVSDTVFQRQWPLGVGELTAHGMEQLYTFGQQFRSRYVDGADKIITGGRYKPTLHYVRSTDVHRTQQSATSLLYGLYFSQGPVDALTNTSLPYSFQPVPISNVPKETDRLLLGLDWADANCNTDRAYAKIISTPMWQAKQAQLSDTLRALSVALKLNVSLNAEFTYANDWLVCDEAHGYLAENWPLITPALFQAAQNITKWIENQFYLQLPIVVKQLYGGRMIGDLISSCDSTIKGVLPYKVLHWSAHDITVMALLMALEVYDGTPPAYASNMFLELRNVNTSAVLGDSSTFTITVFYNSIPLTLPYCNGQVACSYDTFRSHFTSSTSPFALFTDDQAQQVCDTYSGNVQPASTSSIWTTTEIVSVVGLGATTFISVVLAAILCSLKRKVDKNSIYDAESNHRGGGATEYSTLF